MWGFILPFLSPATALLWFCQAPFFHTSFSTKRSFLSRKQAQPSWSLRTLRVLPQRMTPGAFPLYSHSIHGVPAEEIPWEQGREERDVGAIRVPHPAPSCLSLTCPGEQSCLSCAGSPVWEHIPFFPAAQLLSHLASAPRAPPSPKNAFPKLTNFCCFSLASPSCVTPQLLTQPAEGKVALFLF